MHDLIKLLDKTINNCIICKVTVFKRIIKETIMAVNETGKIKKTREGSEYNIKPITGWLNKFMINLLYCPDNVLNSLPLYQVVDPSFICKHLILI